MTTSYDINLNPYELLATWIEQQPNLISIQKAGSKIICEFNHTPTEEITFKQEIASRLFQIDVGNNTFEFTLPKLKELQTDQLIYITEQAVTLTNMLNAAANTYVNIWSDFVGRPHLVDTTGFTKAAIVILWNKIGTGIQNVRLVKDADTTQVLKEFTMAATPTGMLTLEDLNITLPAAFINFKGKLRLQARSTVAADDPVFNGCRIYLRR